MPSLETKLASFLVCLLLRLLGGVLSIKVGFCLVVKLETRKLFYLEGRGLFF